MEQWQTLFSWAPKSLWTVTAAMKLKDACSLVGGKKTKQNTLASWKKSYDQCRQHIKKKRHHFAYQGLYSQSYGFSGSHVWIWEVDHKEGWAMLSNCDAGEDSWESLGQQGNQSWIFIGRTKAEAEAPILWPPDAKSQLIGKDSDAGKD